jgi:S-adenosylmethionine synthetase
MKKLFTSESVTEGHPDKICDQISDAVLDAILANDKNARVACECMATTGVVFVSGEITTSCYVDIPSIARKTILEIGYSDAKFGFDGDNCGIITAVGSQSPDIAMGVDRSLEAKEGKTDFDIGAGDQGMVIGFACTETEDYMPMPITLSHRLAKKLTEVRKTGEIDYLRPDGKSQVTIEYDGDNVVRIDTVVVSCQHNPDVQHGQIEKDILEKVIKAVLPAELMDDKTKFFINPTGRFVIGGPQGDVGLTGRKIIVDTYGGSAAHGGGAFSGKDPTKVDRSASYAARHAAKNIVASGLAEKCEIEIAYAIGVASPVSVYVNTYGTGKVANDRLTEIVNKEFDLRPSAIIEHFDLRRPIYRKTAAYGHFGRPELDLPWEKLDKVEALRKYL